MKVNEGELRKSCKKVIHDQCWDIDYLESKATMYLMAWVSKEVPEELMEDIKLVRAELLKDVELEF